MKSWIYILIFILVIVAIGSVVLYNTKTINDIRNDVVKIENVNVTKKGDDTVVSSNQSEGNGDSTKITDELAVGDFSFDEAISDWYGSTEIKGYLVLVDKKESYCSENCPIHTYGYFKILETNNKNVVEYIEQLKGNSFVQKESIGLGCLEKNIISADSSKIGKKYVLDVSTVDSLKNSSEESPVVLSIEKFKPTDGGRSVGDCFSHLDQVSLKSL